MSYRVSLRKSLVRTQAMKRTMIFYSDPGSLNNELGIYDCDLEALNEIKELVNKKKEECSASLNPFFVKVEKLVESYHQKRRQELQSKPTQNSFDFLKM